MGEPRSFLVITLALLAPGFSFAQEEPTRFGQGTHALRGIIAKPIPGYAKKFELVPLHDYSQLEPANTVIIVLGDPQRLLTLQRRTGGLEKFVQDGGALLVASDHPIREPLSSQFGVQVGGGFLQSDANFQGMPECPLATPAAPGHPIFRRVDTIATNRPRRLLLHPDSPLQILGRVGPLPFIAGRELGRGRVLILSDHSVFINDMMLQATDNFDFAYNCIDWLSGSGQRKRVLFIEDGEIVTQFNVSFKPSLPREDVWKVLKKAAQVFWDAPAQQKWEVLQRLPWDKLAAVAAESAEIGNRALSKVDRIVAEQEARDPNRLATQVFRGRQGFLQFMLALATLGLVLFGLRRLQASRYRIDKAVPLLAGPALTPATSPMMDLRRRAMLESGNCAEVARHLARRCLEAGGCLHWEQMPSFVVQGSFRERWQRHRQLRWLWRLAAAPLPPRVSPQQLADVAALADETKGAFAAGTVRISQ